MQIEAVKLKNFRCFKELDLIVDKTHALIGENASGKTAILEAINLATSGSWGISARLDEQDFNNDDDGDLYIEVFLKKPFLVKIPDSYASQDILCKSVALSAHRRDKASPGKALSDPFVVEQYAMPILYNTGQIPAVDFDITKYNVPVSITKTQDGYESPRKSGSSFKFTTRRLTLQNEFVNFPDIFLIGRDREKESKVGFNSLLQKISKDLNWQFRKKWNQAEVISKWELFYEQVISTVIDPKNDRIMKPVVNKIKDLTGLDLSGLELSLLEIEQPFSKTFFSKRSSSNQIEQRRLGSGISVLISYLLIKTISELSKEKIIFLIDEPELHLHPQLQQKLYKEFRASEHQTIYTTHSDCMVDISEWRSIARFQTDFSIAPLVSDLEAQIEGQKVSAHLDELKKWHQHQLIFFREDNQLFFARRCLLVEGPAEKYGLPILAQKLGEEIGDITILSCNGKNKIPYYQLLCKAFKIPFFTLFDLDGISTTSGENRRPFNLADTSSRFTFPNSFEEFFGVSSDANHKASTVLLIIDAIQSTEIPKDIEKAVKAICNWSTA